MVSESKVGQTKIAHKDSKFNSFDTKQAKMESMSLNNVVTRRIQMATVHNLQIPTLCFYDVTIILTVKSVIPL